MDPPLRSFLFQLRYHFRFGAVGIHLQPLCVRRWNFRVIGVVPPGETSLKHLINILINLLLLLLLPSPLHHDIGERVPVITYG